jgi:hypothetical protein
MNSPQKPDQARRRLMFRVDVKGYGPRALTEHRGVQHAVFAVLGEAAGQAGLDRAGWEEQVGGDSVLAFVPEQDEAEARLVGPFARALAELLAAYNATAGEGEEVRLRMAVHHGLSEPGPLGHTGPGPVLVSRLVDSPQLRRALTASGADLALALSREVHRDTVLQRRAEPLRAADFREVRVSLPDKEFSEPAWLWLPTGDIHELDLAEPAAAVGPEPDRPAPAAPLPQAEVVNVFNNVVHADHAVFGVVQGRKGRR